MNILEEVKNRGGIVDKTFPNIFSFYFFIRPNIPQTIDNRKLKNLTPIVFVLEPNPQDKTIFAIDLLSVRKEVLDHWLPILKKYSKLGRIPSGDLLNIQKTLYQTLGIYNNKTKDRVHKNDPFGYLKVYKTQDIRFLHYIHPNYVDNFFDLPGAWNNPTIENI